MTVVNATTLGSITHFETTEPVVAFTFDDGPLPVSTTRVLEVLRRYGAYGTFFVVGNNAVRHPEIVRRIREQGHALGNHSWDHPSFPLISPEERLDELNRCAAILERSEARLFRPPYGDMDMSTRYQLFRLGYDVVLWNVVAFDWEDRRADAIADGVLRQLRPGCIVVMHDALADFRRPIYIDREPAIAALDQILKEIEGTFRCVTIPELFRIGTAFRRIWIREPDVEELNSLIRPHGSRLFRY